MSGQLARAARWLPVDPFSGIKNRRSIINCGNLASAINEACNLQGKETEILHPIEPSPVSTSELIGAMREAEGKRTLKMPVPAGVIRSAMRLVGRSALYEKIFEDFSLDDRHCRSLLGNYHQVTLTEELARKDRST